MYLENNDFWPEGNPCPRKQGIGFSHWWEGLGHHDSLPGKNDRELLSCPPSQHHDTIQIDTCTQILSCYCPFTHIRITTQCQLTEQQESKHWSTHLDGCLKGQVLKGWFWIFYVLPTERKVFFCLEVNDDYTNI